MHDAALFYVAQFATPDPLEVVELGALNINGSIRHLFPNARYTGVDMVAGPGVDVIGDAATWTPTTLVDLVVCCEVFEHTPVWPKIVDNAVGMLKRAGRLVVTAAGPGREPHSARDGGHLRQSEYYHNVTTNDLYRAFFDAELVAIQVEQFGDDVRATGVKG